MNRENEKHSSDDYYREVEEGGKRPGCISCGDSVKIVVHSGGKAMAAKHCKECYAELRYGKIPKYIRKRGML
jgi:hypothetical protein